jgi:hypothetical protein
VNNKRFNRHEFSGPRVHAHNYDIPGPVGSHSTSIAVSVNTSDAEKQALVDLYHSTNGEDWTTSTNWLVGDPCLGNWFGVTCDDNGGGWSSCADFCSSVRNDQR